MFSPVFVQTAIWVLYCKTCKDFAIRMQMDRPRPDICPECGLKRKVYLRAEPMINNKALYWGDKIGWYTGV